MVVTSRQHARRGTAGTPASRSFGRVRLFLRMRRGERIEVHARIEYPPHGGVGIEVAPIEHVRAGHVRNEAKVRQGRSVAAAKSAGAPVPRQHLLDGTRSRIEPMAQPREAGRLVEM